MSDIIRLSPEGYQEVRTGLGWRRVLSSTTTSQAAETLPVIDLASAQGSDPSSRKVLAKEVTHAAITSGFFYVRGHGVPEQVVASIFTQTRRFFHDLSLEEKMEFDTEKHDHYYGYYPIKFDPDQPAGAKLNEGINYGYEPSIDSEATTTSSHNGENWWPTETQLPGYQDAVKQDMSHMLRLSRSLLRLFAIGLDLDEHIFDPLATQPYSILKMAHYPGSFEGSQEPSSIRPHSDFELLTILLQDKIPSLEVLSNSGTWIQATPIPGTFVVNIGDTLSMLTNGLFQSTMHRVRNTSGKARYSVPFFLGANQDAEIKALDEFVTPDHPPKFHPISSGEYIRRSLQAVYSKPHIEIVRETIEV